jgi:hypothetical protein
MDTGYGYFLMIARMALAVCVPVDNPQVLCHLDDFGRFLATFFLKVEPVV